MRRPEPGALLLKLARLLFDESVLSRVVHPTISDLQEEVRKAGADGRRRVLARWRGYRAFWVLVLAGPLVFWNWPMTPHDDRRAFVHLSALTLAALVVVTLLTTSGIIDFRYIAGRVPVELFAPMGDVHTLAFMAGPLALLVLLAFRWLRGPARFTVRTAEAVVFSLLSATVVATTGTIVLIDAFTGIARTGGGGVNIIADAIGSSLGSLIYAGVAVATCLLLVAALTIRADGGHEAAPGRVPLPRMPARLAVAVSVVVALTVVAVDQLLRTYYQTLELLLSPLEPGPRPAFGSGTLIETLARLEHNVGVLIVIGVLLTGLIVVSGVMTWRVSRTRAPHPTLTWTSRAALAIVLAGAVWHTTEVWASLDAYQGLPARWAGYAAPGG